MKKVIFIVLSLLFIKYSFPQSISFVKDTLIQNTSVDSMNEVNLEKIIPFRDSGFIVMGTIDSVNNQSLYFCTFITAYDKNMNLLWNKKFGYQTYFGTVKAITDKDFNIYLSYPGPHYYQLAKFTPNGKLIYNVEAGSYISYNAVFNDLKMLNGKIYLHGLIYNSSSKSIQSFIAKFDTSCNFISKISMSPSSNAMHASEFNFVSLINITKENNLVISYQVDSMNNYAVACYDTLFSKKWSKSLNAVMAGACALYNRGSNVVLATLHQSSMVLTWFEFDSKIGTGGNELDQGINLSGDFPRVLLPTLNGNYLSFGNYSTSGGFDNAIDYFSESGTINSILSNTTASRNSISDACYLGNYIYTVAIKFVDKYTYPAVPYNYRGMLWLKKFKTDFLTQTLGIRNEYASDMEFNLYPNPGKGIFKMDVSETGEIKTVQVLNSLGKEVYSDNLPSSKTNMDLSFLPAGIYYVRIESGETIACRRLVIE